MRAYTLKQPWAWAICHFTGTDAYKPKRTENRSFRPHGIELGDPIGIHAGKTIDRKALEMLRDILKVPIPEEDLALGAFVGVAPFRGVKRRDGFDTRDPWYSPGCFGTMLGQPVVFEPVPATGNLGCWTVPESDRLTGEPILQQLREAMERPVEPAEAIRLWRSR